MLRLGILGSTRGTSLLPVIAAIEQGLLQAEIAVVISNKPDAMILERARELHLVAEYVPLTENISERLKAHKVDLVVLIGFMRILPAEFVKQWKTINVHPSLLPAFAGGMDQNVHAAVLASGVKETGCTVHLVTEQVDAGPILVQKKCAVLPSDTVETLKTRVQALEGLALIEAIKSFLH